MHYHNVLHRDIKPHNLLLVGGTVKVADFGLAKLLSRTVSTQTGLKGTPAYVAPEIVQGKPTRSSDQYSLAISYCHLRTGRLPIAADSVMALLFAHVHEPPDLTGYDSREAKVLEKALSKNPAGRWNSCQEFVKALRKSFKSSTENPRKPRVRSAVASVIDDQQEPRQPKHGLKAGEVWSDNQLNMPFIWCPPGEFKMGNKESEGFQRYHVDPVEVKLTKGFWLGKFPVTQDEWSQIMHSNPKLGSGFVSYDRRCPVTFVSWKEAIVFCKRFTEIERDAGRLSQEWKYTLPSEAQWEYACRAGTTTHYHFDHLKSDLADFAWFDENTLTKGETYAHPVGQKKPNPWGLYDMHGNVWEWCRDGGGIRRVVRGGSWYSSSENCRSAERKCKLPAYAEYDLGFRIIRVSSKQ